jgi:hypothetical protein
VRPPPEPLLTLEEACLRYFPGKSACALRWMINGEGMRIAGGVANTASHLRRSRPLWTTLPSPLTFPTRTHRAPLPRHAGAERKHTQAGQRRLRGQSRRSIG